MWISHAWQKVYLIVSTTIEENLSGRNNWEDYDYVEKVVKANAGRIRPDIP